MNRPESAPIPVKSIPNVYETAAKNSRSKRCSSETILLTATVVGAFMGICIGVIIKFSSPKYPTITPRDNMYLSFVGDVFLRMLKLLILPLITSTLISSLACRKTPQGRIGLIATVYYLTTTISAALLGIALVLVIKPGQNGDDMPVVKDTRACKGTLPADTVLDLIRNMIPQNLFAATFQSVSTCIKYVAYNGTKKMSFSEYQSDLNLIMCMQSAAQYDVPYQITKSSTNILGLVVFSMILGSTINKMGPDGYPLAEFFKSLEGAMMRMVNLVIWFSPIGIMFLIAGRISAMDDLLLELKRLGMYMGTVIAGLLIHAMVVLPCILYFVAKRNPFKFVYGMTQAYLTALGTASSSATIPLTLKCLEDNLKIDPKVTRFVIPVGATINMDGTALYEAVAAIYIAQTQNIALDFGQVIMISFTATLASIGAAGIPEAGLVTMIMVLIAVGLDPALFSLIVPVDWFLDRIRTMINVHGDSIGAAVVDRFVNKRLDNTPMPVGDPFPPQEFQGIGIPQPWPPWKKSECACFVEQPKKSQGITPPLVTPTVIVEEENTSDSTEKPPTPSMTKSNFAPVNKVVNSSDKVAMPLPSPSPNPSNSTDKTTKKSRLL